MRITINKQGKPALYKQIYEQIRGHIVSGALPPGGRLPPERQLAEVLGVNRTTVLAAYRELKAEGFVASHVGRGTTVSAGHAAAPAPAAARRQAKAGPIWEHRVSDRSRTLDDATIFTILQLINTPGIISFAGGISSPETQPLAALAGLEAELGRERHCGAFAVSPIGGFASLRKLMSAHMHAGGVFCHPEEIMIISGSQQGIDLLSRLFINPGDIVFVEEPSFFPAMHAFQAAGARLMGIPMTPEGMDVDVLEHMLHRDRPKFIYTMPTYHNPCGCSLLHEKKIRLLELAARYDCVIVEDDPYSGLYYGETPPGTLKALDSKGYVVYLSTFSKIVAPGFRLGWICAPRKLINLLSSIKQYVDIHSSSVAQYVIERFIASGALADHMQAMRALNRQKRDAMLAALARYAPHPAPAAPPAPEGGSYLWYRLPEGVSASRLLPLASRAGVAVLPGTLFHLAAHQGERYLRLNFTYESQKRIDTGVRLLSACMAELARAGEAGQSHSVSSLTTID